MRNCCSRLTLQQLNRTRAERRACLHVFAKRASELALAFTWSVACAEKSPFLPPEAVQKELLPLASPFL
jgi:hypothetical protein